MGLCSYCGHETGYRQVALKHDHGGTLRTLYGTKLPELIKATSEVGLSISSSQVGWFLCAAERANNAVDKDLTHITHAAIAKCIDAIVYCLNLYEFLANSRQGAVSDQRLRIGARRTYQAVYDTLSSRIDVRSVGGADMLSLIKEIDELYASVISYS